MIEQEFKDAFAHVRASDDLIREVLSLEKKDQRLFTVRKILWRIAAIAAAVAILFAALAFWPDDENYVTAPGVIKVYAYDTTSGTDLESMIPFDLTDPVSSEKNYWFPYASLLSYMPLTLECDANQYENEDIFFSVSVNWGRFLRYLKPASNEMKTWERLGAEFTIANGETIWWDAIGTNEEIKEVIEEDGGIFADILIYAGEHLIGYVVIEFLYFEKTPAFISTVTCMECFPMIDGEYQEKTEEEIRGLIYNYRQKTGTGGD